ncbi:hypothetical protein B0H15DRAFT_942402 [Mycena belliarum]|uniref:Zn(2)-C6 fungal-type domain-containing protein n=1 Tax=Mycena belliarum TaxID=1033014 RepID=A0AAD6Y0B1_9AGAR|nr:hypothetical protein B0H15DRAFT_942402 [Mycena belliae]
MDESPPAVDSNTVPAASNSARKSQITSCAECRRLKLRCDRVFPCSSCIRRGCANLCPNGTLEKGKRGFLKRLEQSLPSAYPKPGGEIEHSEVAMFVARDAAMMKRIQELEAALAGAGIAIPGPTPGIAAEPQDNEGRAKRPRTLSLSDPVTPSAALEIEKNPLGAPAPDATDVTLGFGTLTIDVENRSRYIGPSGGAAYEIIPEDIFFSVHLPNIYPNTTSPRVPTNLHVLSLFAMVLSLGVFFDLSFPISDVRDQAAEFYDLAVAAIQISIPLKLDTIPAVQTVHLMALYFLSIGGESGGEPRVGALELVAVHLNE